KAPYPLTSKNTAFAGRLAIRMFALRSAALAGSRQHPTADEGCGYNLPRTDVVWGCFPNEHRTLPGKKAGPFGCAFSFQNFRMDAERWLSENNGLSTHGVSNRKQKSPPLRGPQASLGQSVRQTELQ